ncbi:MAG: BatD family protein [Kiritimatiellaeota bacterium]|nr:BatD family protein [Kiritimatiellota bacterium]
MVRFWGVLAAAVAGFRAVAATVSVSADVAQVYVQDAFTLTVRVEGTQAEVSEVAFDKVGEAVMEGPSVQMFQNTSIVNGKVTQHISRTLSYRVTPQEAGELAFRRVSVRCGGETLSATGPVIRVIGAEAQDVLFVALSSSPESVLVDEPFDVTLAVTVRRLDAPNDGFDPFQVEPPGRLAIPYLDGVPPQGLTMPDLNALLQPLVSRRQFGFSINGIASRGTMSSFFGADPFSRSVAIAFDLPRENATWNGKAAWTYTLTARFTAQIEGTYTFGPASFKGGVITGIRRNGAQIDDIYAIAPAVSVRVTPPTLEGRPPSYAGVLGQSMAATSKLDAQTCRQGDLLQLTVDVSGQFNVAHLRPPALSSIPGMEERFRVYDDSVRSSAIPDGRRYAYTVRPLLAGTQEFPAIPLSYFDTEARAYKTVATEPIPLRVEAVAEFDPASIIRSASARDSAEGLLSVHSDATVPAGITVTLGTLRPLAPTPAFWLAIFALPLGTLAVAGCVALAGKLPAVRRRVRRIKALSRATAEVRHAATAAELWQAVQGYFRDRYGVAAETLSPDDMARLVPAAIAPSLLAVLQPIFDRQYRRDATSVTDADRAAIEHALTMAKG